VTAAGNDPPSQKEYLERNGTLTVMRVLDGGDQVELFLVLEEGGSITAFNGHVDLGTGVRTALMQIVAEELDVPIERVRMVLGDVTRGPNQGPTIASETIQVSAIPLRAAAAQAREFLLVLAAERIASNTVRLRMQDGVIVDEDGGDTRIPFESLIKGRQDRLMLSTAVPLKPVADYRVVGRSVQRVDIPQKATGQWLYVHDVRLSSMLHGRVVRPPYAGLDHGEFIGTSLLSIDESSIASCPGVVAIVAIRDFVGIVAEREEQAVKAAELLRVSWKPGPTLPDLNDLGTTLRSQPGRARILLNKGDVDHRLKSADKRLRRTYVWPYQMHASIGPSCAVAEYSEGALTVWSGTQNPHTLRADLALLLGIPESQVNIIRLEAAGCYGRNCADDVSADAALLARAVGRPVRVQLTREQEHLWEPKGAAQLMEVDGGLDAGGAIAAYDFSTRYPSNAAPTLALLLTGAIAPVPDVLEMGDRTAIPPYQLDHIRVVVHDVAPILRASWLRGVSALPNSFAHESYIDELAAEAQADPIEFRLRYLEDTRAIELIKSVASRADWKSRTGPRRQLIRDGIAYGQGFAYALYKHGTFPGTAAAWSAWVAEVEVDVTRGDVNVTRVVVGQDSGLVINPAGIRHQIHGNVIQSVSRALKERLHVNQRAVTSREWGAYPILTFPEVPVIEVVLMPQADEPPLGVGESASVPSAAAIANAIFDATGVRLREPPFTAERMRAALAAGRDYAPALRIPSWLRRLGLMMSGAVGLAVTLLAWRAAIEPTRTPELQLYSTATIARGEQLAALGDCMVCHTKEAGPAYAGGRPLDTPFGTVYSTNITPDLHTGIGTWSYPAFERAMREGIHRDGRHLYPAFPYTAFAKTSDDDLQALYAYIMSRPPISAEVPQTRLNWPFNQRPLIAFWNALFLRSGAYQPNPERSDQWNRGAYLVEGLGHCGACHSPRNLMGAEIGGSRSLGGGFADGWEAPPLTALSHAPVPWTEAELFGYLRYGVSRLHGVAGGPMAPVVSGLAELPAQDVRAMAHYLASFGTQSAPDLPEQLAQRLETATSIRNDSVNEAGARLFEGACAACHDPLAYGVLGVRPSLALNTNLHSPNPNNLLRAVLEGVDVPAMGPLGAMPSFRNSLDDTQLDQLLRYLRAQFAPDKPAWKDIAAASAKIRSQHAAHF
jgi:nicotinate dehydrogenase subunit B